MLPNEKISLRSRLGFIGLGHLGSPIARRLIRRRTRNPSPPSARDWTAV